MSFSLFYTPKIWLPLVTVIFILALAAYSWRRRSTPGALPFFIGCLFVVFWSAGSVMEAASVDIATKTLWGKFQTLFQLPAVTAVTCFILEYTWPGRWLTHRNLALLSIFPLMAVGLILSNDIFHVMWFSFTANGTEIRQDSPVGWFFIYYAYALGLVEIVAFTWLFKHSPQHRWPIAFMLTGMVGGRAVYALGLTRNFLPDLPFDVIAIGIVFIMYAVAFFHFRIFDPIPMARMAAIEQLQAGMLVLDPQGRIASLNPSAEKILGISASRAKGRLVKELLPAYPGGHIPAPNGTEIEISLGTGQATRHYLMGLSHLKDWRGLELGQLLMLQDITEQKQAQAQIVEQQRALAMLQEREHLARELHDNLGQVFAFVNTQGQTIRRLLSRGDLATADEYTSRLIDVAREADIDIRESILGLRLTLSEQGFFPALTKYLARYEKNYQIHACLEVPETFEEDAFEPLVDAQLLRILQEALTNVRKHAQAQDVRIRFSNEGKFARIVVQDDGNGFDPRDQVEGFGDHVGLRVMRERAEVAGGSLSLQSQPGHGTIVEVTMPLKKTPYQRN